MPYWEQQALSLECLPPVAEHIARPWDSADEYALRQLDAQQPTLVINDRYGALACSLAKPVIWLESACARRSTQANMERNQLQQPLRWVSHPQALVDVAADEMPHQVILRIPKNLDQLRYWIEICRQHLPADTRYFLAGMAKHIPVSWLNWLEANSGQYRQFPIERKARLMEISEPHADKQLVLWQGYRLDESEQPVELKGLPGVFSRNSQDIGSRFLLEQHQARQLPLHGKVCDLGCGNGLLGIALAKRFPDIELTLADDSLLAVESAIANAEHNGLQATVAHSDLLEDVIGTFDFIVCNPPFHDGHKQMSDIAELMFEQSAARLQPQGELLVIANRHLPYRPVLKRFFRKADVIAENPKFMLYRCRRPL